jgi:hypothetical protein
MSRSMPACSAFTWRNQPRQRESPETARKVPERGHYPHAAAGADLGAVLVISDAADVVGARLVMPYARSPHPLAGVYVKRGRSPREPP